MIDYLQPYFSKFSSILKSYQACKVLSYKAAATALVPRFIKHPPKLIDKGSYLLIQSGESAPIVIPVTLSSPKELIKVLIITCEEYGGVFDIPKPYADALATKGYTLYKRPWGNIDFVFETQHLIKLSGGRYKQMRKAFRKFKSDAFTQRLLLSEEYVIVDELCELWAKSKKDQGGRVGNIGYAAEYTKHLDLYPEEMRALVLGTFYGDSLIGVSIGCMLTSDFWVTGYGYGDKTYRSIITYGLHSLSKHYEDVPFECDGDAGTPSSGIYHHKQKLLSPLVLNKQNYSYVVKNER